MCQIIGFDQTVHVYSLKGSCRISEQQLTMDRQRRNRVGQKIKNFQSKCNKNVSA